jgi:DNA-binding IscR family transcriptional regulator
LRLSRAAEYAVRCMLYLSIAGKGVLVSRKRVALEMDIPDSFWEKSPSSWPGQSLLRSFKAQKAGFA